MYMLSRHMQQAVSLSLSLTHTHTHIHIWIFSNPQSWERDSLPSRPSTMKVKRTLPSGGNIYVDPPVLRQGPESDTKDFDDLLYALKTGGSFTPSDINSSDSDKLSDISSKLDKYELRRIDIADTHLWNDGAINVRLCGMYLLLFHF